MKYPEYKQFNQPELEQEILKFWEDNSIFAKSISERENATSFVFYEGPPSANGMPGIHHVMARTIKDIFCRYKTQQGFQVHRKAGWDTHGLPIELQVEKELGITKDDIGTKISIEEYNQKCRETVMKYTSEWETVTKAMGYWVDMQNPYVTYHNEYIESVWHLLKRLHEKGLLYKGYTIQPFSPKAGTGLSSHELNQPGCYKEVTDTTITAQFKVKHSEKSAFLFEDEGEDVRVLAWTTTPWTLPANCALAVGEKITYVKVKTFNQYTGATVSVVLAKDRLAAYCSPKDAETAEFTLENYKKGDKKIPYRVVGEFAGKELVGVRYEQLMPYVTNEDLEQNAFRVIAGDFVTTEDGTGVVHTASVFGADDFRVATQNGVPSVLVKDEEGNVTPLVTRQGKFVPQLREGLNKDLREVALKLGKQENEFALPEYMKPEYEEAPKREGYMASDVLISILLKEQNKAFKVEKYAHNYPHCWRTDKPILYYPLDSWFIRTTALRDRMADLNKTINWKPESTGTGRFGNWLENLVDWNLSRQRYWGIPLPVWRTEDGKEELCIGSKEQLLQEIEKAMAAGLMEKNPWNPTPSPSPLREGDAQSTKDAAKHQPYSAPFYQTSPEKWALLKNFVQSNRKNPTKAEESLWQELRNKKLDTKFRRQHAIEGFIVDFVSLESALVVEVDGEIHEQQKEYDEARTEFLNSLGFEVIRFTNEEVLGDIGNVVSKIKDKLAERQNGGNNESPSLKGEGLGVGFDLHRPYVDNIVLLSPTGKPMFRETDLIDVWFDSGAMPYAQNHYPFNKELFPHGAEGSPAGTQGVYPADFISEGVDQTRGWFFTLHAIAVLLFDSVAFKNVVSTGLVLDRNGEKMSKRKGNVVEPLTVTKKAVVVLGKNEKGEPLTEETPEPYEVEGALSKYGADATRWYMISNSNPWDNLKFSWISNTDHAQKKIFGQSDGIEEVQRKLFGTLRNTYGFFAMYANLDGFAYQENEIPLAERTESDRWIISRLNSLVKDVTLSLDEYEPTRAARAIQEFVNDDLSNWYVRLNRKRFWKSETQADKIAAYQTLYACLETVAKLIAPIAPFYAERLFLDLNNVSKRDKNASVHLSDFPKVQENALDLDLEEKMHLAQSISSLTHSIRKKLTIRVRQPLSKILLPISDKRVMEQVRHVAEIIKDEVNVKEIDFMTDDSALVSKTVKPNFKTLGAKYKQQMKDVQNAVLLLSREDISTLERGGSVGKEGFDLVLEDVLITSQDVEGLSTATDGTITVALDVSISPALRQEGIARDFVNRTQNYRKDSNFEVQDKIKVRVSNQHGEVVEALRAFSSYICTETQALDLAFDTHVEGQTFEIEEFAFEVSIEKA